MPLTIFTAYVLVTLVVVNPSTPQFFYFSCKSALSSLGDQHVASWYYGRDKLMPMPIVGYFRLCFLSKSICDWNSLSCLYSGLLNWQFRIQWSEEYFRLSIHMVQVFLLYYNADFCFHLPFLFPFDKITNTFVYFYAVVSIPP